MFHKILNAFRNGLEGLEEAIEDIRDKNRDESTRRLVEKDRRVDALLLGLAKDGSKALSKAEILEAEFGMSDINGLEIIAPPQGEVPVGKIGLVYWHRDYSFSKKVSLKLSHFGLYNWTHGISLESLPSHSSTSRIFQSLYNPNKYMHRASTLGHELIHAFQDDVETGMNSFYPGAHTQSVLHTGMGQSFREKALAWRENIHRFKLEMAYTNPFAYPIKALQLIAGRGNRLVSDYYAIDIEMQARIHQIMVDGYQVWEKMPSNRTELNAALSSSGLNVPEHIRHHLDNTLEGRQACRDFSDPGLHFKLRRRLEISELNAVYNYAYSPSIRAAFFDRMYPELYGQQLEFYGDRLGRERMACGRNPKKAMEIIKTVEAEEGGELSPETLQAIHTMDSQDVPLLLNGLVSTVYYNAFMADRPYREARFLNVLNAVMGNKGHKQALKAYICETGEQDKKTLYHQYGSVLEAVIYFGGAESADKLIEDFYNAPGEAVRELIKSVDALKYHQELAHLTPTLPKPTKKVFSKKAEYRHRNLEILTQLKNSIVHILQKRPELARNPELREVLKETGLDPDHPQKVDFTANPPAPAEQKKRLFQRK